MRGPSAPRRRQKFDVGTLRDLARAVADRRLALGLTQADLADLAGVGLASVRGLEAGKSSLSLSVALRILDALGLAVGMADVPIMRSDPRITLIGTAR